MSKQQREAELVHCYDAEGNALFSDKVIGRFAAMSALTDCRLVSAEGTAYPVHKLKLLEQSKVLGRVRAVATTRCRVRMRRKYSVLRARPTRHSCIKAAILDESQLL